MSIAISDQRLARTISPPPFGTVGQHHALLGLANHRSFALDDELLVLVVPSASSPPAERNAQRAWQLSMSSIVWGPTRSAEPG